ncbi:MAG TPA: DUF3298 and DUF4163 domain-containing protein [Thermoanaerobaculia bacterium]|nr:DUF3298 and DUF4163 domain-containing protein [Thermoanaerobaculia bacterium]
MREVLALALFGVAGCSQASAPPVADLRTASEAPPAFELRTVERSEGDCGTDGAPCAHFLARFPVLTGGVRPAVQEAVNRRIARLVASGAALIEGGEPEEAAGPATVEEAAAEFLAGWTQAREELPEDAPRAYHRWADERRMEVLHADHRLLSVELLLYAFTGGAHPNTFAALESFDLATGEPVALEDLVAEGAGARLEALGERHFRREREIPETESLEEAGFWFEDDRFHLPDNFAVTGDGLVFVFNPYEVAPYVFGPTRITLPWNELQGLLLPNAPVAPASVGL